MTSLRYVVRRTAASPPGSRKGRMRLGRLDIELTERCNHNCIHCCINRPAHDAAARAREMPAEQIKDILRQAAALGCLSVRFTGGEPLLRPDVEDLYVYARQLGLTVVLFTNACLITSPLADLFARVPPLTPIEVSVYGMHAESYTAVTRTPGGYAQFRRGVNLLRRRRVPFIVKSVWLPQLRSERDEFEAWAESLLGLKRPPNYTLFLDRRSRRDDPRKDAQITTLRPSSHEVLTVLTRDPAQYRRVMSLFAARFIGPPGDRLFGCGAGHGLSIDAYGRAQPCMSMRAPELTVGLDGAVRLTDALERFRRLADVRATNPDYLSRCARCFLKGMCEQCPARSWGEHGTLDTPVAHLCEATHVQARYLGWLDEKEMGWEVIDWQERIRSVRRPLNGEGRAGAAWPHLAEFGSKPFITSKNDPPDPERRC